MVFGSLQPLTFPLSPGAEIQKTWSQGGTCEFADLIGSELGGRCQTWRVPFWWTGGSDRLCLALIGLGWAKAILYGIGLNQINS